MSAPLLYQSGKVFVPGPLVGTEQVVIDNGGSRETVTTAQAIANLGGGLPSGIGVYIDGTTYTLQQSDNGNRFYFTTDSGCVVTLPSGLVVPFGVTIIQYGEGQATIVFTDPVAMNNLNFFTQTAGQFAVLSLFADFTDVYTLTGEGA